MKSVFLSFHLSIDTRTESGTRLILDALAENGLHPDWQAPHDMRRDPYDITAFVAEAGSWGFDGNFLLFGARDGTRWSGTLTFDTDVAPTLSLEFGEGRRAAGRRTAKPLGETEAREWFDLASELAHRFGPLFGVCATRFGVRPYDYVHQINPGRDGLRWRSPRTFFGGWLLDSIGAERLAGLGHSSRRLESCLEVDLVPSPWSAPWEDVVTAGERAQHALADVPIWGDYVPGNRKPPPGWAGFPRVKT